MKSIWWMVVDYGGNAKLLRTEPRQLGGTEIALEVVIEIPERVTRRRNAIHVQLPDLQPEVTDVRVALNEPDPNPEPATAGD